MTLSPSASRRQLGAELRRLRQAANLRIEDAARILECSTAKVSRLENGKGRPLFRDVRDLVQAYVSDAEAHLPQLRDLVAAGSQEDWLDDFKDVAGAEIFSDHLSLDSGGRFVALERDAAELKSFEPDYFPGILQTAEYVDAICRGVFPEQTAQERARFVEYRRRRQEAVLRRPQRPQVTTVVSELTMLRHAMVEPAVLRRQIEHLVTTLQAELSWVEFRLAPIGRQPSDAAGGPFYILKFANPSEQDIVYLEGREEPDYLETQNDVRKYERRLENLIRCSLTREASLSRLAAEAAALTP